MASQPTPLPTPTWDDTLASYQQHLDAVAVLIASSQTTTIPEWEPPSGLGPMPAALVGLANTLNDQAEELMRALTVAMAKTRMEYESLSRASHTQPAPAPRAMIRTTMLDEKA